MPPNTADVRQFLTDYFRDEELTTLCFDFFPEVYNSFASGMSKGQKTQLLLEYVQRREQQSQLLGVLQQQRPDQYRRRFPPHSDPPGAEPSHAASPINDSRVPNPNPAAGSSRALRIFLCHSSADKPAVRELYQRLRADGFEPWLDEENLLPGQDWQLEIPKAVRESDAVIVCLSKGSINKAGYVQREIKFALDAADEQPDETIFLIPVKLEECEVPQRLSRWQWVNLFSPNGYERLMRALKVRATGLGRSVSPAQPSVVPSIETKSEVIASRVMTTTITPRIIARDVIPETRVVAPNVQIWGDMEFVRIPAGKFLMGSTADNPLASDAEKPQHTVEIAYDYWLARYPVTNEQFAKFVEEPANNLGLYKFSLENDWKKKVDHPVVNVSWHDATVYCQWLNEVLRNEVRDLQVRLPTEAEWEKAARGEYGNEWPWGNDFDKNKCNCAESKNNGTTPVGAYSPQGDSPYGIADMAGNVCDWMISLWGRDSSEPQYSYPYQLADGRERLSAPNEVLRVLRGGSFRYHAGDVRTAHRRSYDPPNRIDDVGFRVVVAPRLSSRRI